MDTLNGVECRFLEFRFLPDQARLLRGKDEIDLSPKCFQFLSVLISASNAVVYREALFELLWNGRSVSDECLAQVVAQTRRTLDDSAARQRIVKTVPKLGYRFVPNVELITLKNQPVKEIAY